MNQSRAHGKQPSAPNELKQKMKCVMILFIYLLFQLINHLIETAQGRSRIQKQKNGKTFFFHRLIKLMVMMIECETFELEMDIH